LPPRKENEGQDFKKENVQQIPEILERASGMVAQSLRRKELIGMDSNFNKEFWTQINADWRR